MTLPLQSWPTYHVAHRLELDAASHAARRTRLLHLGFIGLIQLPDGVAGMAENPEVVSTNIAELLQVGLVNSRAVKLLDECVRLDRRAGVLAGGWRGCKEEGFDEREESGVWAGQDNEIAGSC